MIYALVPVDPIDEPIKLYHSSVDLARALIESTDEHNRYLFCDSGEKFEHNQQNIAQRLINDKNIHISELGEFGSVNELYYGTRLMLNDPRVQSDILLNVLSICDGMDLQTDKRTDRISFFSLSEAAAKIIEPNGGLPEADEDTDLQAMGLQLAFFDNEGYEVNYNFTIESLLVTPSETLNGTRLWTVKDSISGEMVTIVCYKSFNL